jgi:hypothetical protein
MREYRGYEISIRRQRQYFGDIYPPNGRFALRAVAKGATEDDVMADAKRIIDEHFAKNNPSEEGL